MMLNLPSIFLRCAFLLALQSVIVLTLWARAPPPSVLVIFSKLLPYINGTKQGHMVPTFKQTSIFILIHKYVFVKVTPYEEDARTRSLVLYANGSACTDKQQSNSGKLNPGNFKERNLGKMNDIMNPILSMKNGDLR